MKLLPRASSILVLVFCSILGSGLHINTLLADSSPISLNTKNSSLENTNFKTYTNESFGISIQYPANWTFVESDTNPTDTITDIVIFATSQEYLLNPGPKGALFSVSVDKLPPNMTINDYGKNVSNLFNSAGLSNIVNFNGITLGKHPAYELQVDYGIPGQPSTLKILERGTFVGNQVYTFSYGSEPSLFGYYLPVAQEAADSLEVSAINEPQQEQTITSYHSKTYRFSIDYPSSWIVEESLGNYLGVDIALAITAPQESRFDNESENILVGVASISPGLSLDDFVARSLEYTEENSPSFKLINSNETSLSGSPAQTIIFKRDPDMFPQAVQGIQILTVHDNKGYDITYTASTHYDKYLEAAQKIMKSFRFS